ncbi:hypothetical protein PoB_000055900 [Plakobranchus ocellatus]|uniref:Uncharacterized protein n=1 Tax=Plakobranchus ocellatus TaxID=259542 RepID=A0AAV3XSD5_9GAST|nr:hypothetical protein PoB_000055900 [Plakobranchus ocellatus]
MRYQPRVPARPSENSFIPPSMTNRSKDSKRSTATDNLDLDDAAPCLSAIVWLVPGLLGTSRPWFFFPVLFFFFPIAGKR